MNSAVKALLLVLRYLTHIGVQTELGSQMYRELRLLLTVSLSVFTLAPVAYVQVRLQEQSNLIDNLNGSTDQSFYSGLFLLSKYYRLFTNKLVVYGLYPFSKLLYIIYLKNSKNPKTLHYPTPFLLVFCLV